MSGFWLFVVCLCRCVCVFGDDWKNNTFPVSCSLNEILFTRQCNFQNSTYKQKRGTLDIDIQIQFLSSTSDIPCSSDFGFTAANIRIAQKSNLVPHSGRLTGSSCKSFQLLCVVTDTITVMFHGKAGPARPSILTLHNHLARNSRVSRIFLDRKLKS